MSYPGNPKHNLQDHPEREWILARSVTRIRRILDSDKIFSAATEELRQVLACDRTIVYQFQPDWSGLIVAESVLPNWEPLQSRQISEAEIQADVIETDNCTMQALKGGEQAIETADTYLQETRGGVYSEGLPYRVVNDITKAGFSDCYRQFLERLEAKAYIIVPLFVENLLWGLVCAYQNDQSRVWSDQDINIVVHIGEHISVALQQAQLLTKTQRQAESLKEALQYLKATQSQLVQSEKMSSLGQLVAGIAHEINNPVNFIFGNLTHVSQYINELLELIACYELHHPQPHPDILELREQLELDYMKADLTKAMSSMQLGAKRIREIVLSLRTFSRLDEAEKKEANIHEGIDSTLMILQSRINSRSDRPEIGIHKDYGEIPLICCYPGQLNQVFMNIFVNAIDALEDFYQSQSPAVQAQTELMIQIQTQMISGAMIDAEHSAPSANQPSKAGDSWLKVTIQDNGPGMEESIRSKLFDPFFTTKGFGKGTGLGLSISHQIVVDKHGGFLRCESSLGQGAKFIIAIPQGSLK